MAEVQRRGYGWRSIFLINLPIGAAVIASLSLIPEIEANPGEKVDKLGTLVFGTAIILVVLPLIEGPVSPWVLAFLWPCGRRRIAPVNRNCFLRPCCETATIWPACCMWRFCFQ